MHHYCAVNGNKVFWITLNDIRGGKEGGRCLVCFPGYFCLASLVLQCAGSKKTIRNPVKTYASVYSLKVAFRNFYLMAPNLLVKLL